MSMGYVRALHTLHRAFGRYPPRQRAHLLSRFLTCPFLRVIPDVPLGRVLDIGAGQGLFATLLAADGARQVVALDPDLRKSLRPSPSPSVRKVAGRDECIRGEFDAVVITDMVYRMSLEDRREMFARVLARLRSGGSLVVKELDPAHLKMKWARFQERLVDRFLGLTIGSGLVYQTREEFVAVLRELGFAEVRWRAIDRGYPHPHIVYTARKP